MNDNSNIDRMEETDEHPLGTIALSLSGGGERAAGFHLGVLAYLERVDLLKDVSILSSVSGGSLVAAKYALTLKTAPEEEPLHDTFRRFYEEYFAFTMRSDFISRVFKKLGAPPERRPTGRNSILAVADIFDESEQYMNGARFDVFWGPREIHIQDLIINAVEFKTGMPFRFHYKNKQSRRSGNRFVPFPEIWARKARLADIVAASSCVPVLAEPIFFPRDFRWPKDEPKLRGEIEEYIAYQCGNDMQGNRVRSVALMDGGLYDLGTDSVAVALSEESHEDLEKEDMVAARFVQKYDEIPIVAPLGVFIISDAPILNDNIYPVPAGDDPAGAGGGLTLGHLNIVTLAFVLIAAFIFVLNAGEFIGALVMIGRDLAGASPLTTVLGQLWTFLTFGMPVIISLSLLIMVELIRGKVVAFLSELPESDPVENAKLDKARAEGGLGWLERHRIARRRWKEFRGLGLEELLKMISLRLSSTWALTGAMFLNRIRSLGFALLENRDDLKGRLIKNVIYDIVELGDKASRLAPSAPMLAVAQRASSMRMELWWKDVDELRDLIACGNFTICYNLLEYIDNLRLAEGQEDLKATLYVRLESDWNILKEDPFALIDELERENSGRETPDASYGR